MTTRTGLLPRAGYYCTHCGTVHTVLPEGIVSCQSCGHTGLRGYWQRLERISCYFPGCNWTGWDDGGVNDDAGNHLRLAHPEAWVQAKQVPRKGWAVFVMSGEKVWPADEHAWRQRVRAWDIGAEIEHGDGHEGAPMSEAVHRAPDCGHKLLMECPLTVQDWGTVFDAYCGFLAVCRIVSERAHDRADKAAKRATTRSQSTR